MISPYPIKVLDAAIRDLRLRLSLTRWPDRETVDDASQGARLAAITRLCGYWRESYDWRACERLVNELGSSSTVVDGLRIHFLHVRSGLPNALPLVLTHGWPSSILEFRKVIAPLTNPLAHGGDASDAFDLVIPSLPGHGFSEKPTTEGWGTQRIAKAWVGLVKQLGYGDRWMAAGGDWGSAVHKHVAALDPPGCLGIHLIRMFLLPTEAEKAAATPDEQAWMAKSQRSATELSGYARQQSTRPQTLGYALADSPAGQAAWIYEKYCEWTDCDGDPERIMSIDEILDHVMLYWITNAATSAARLYRESHAQLNEDVATTIPLAVTQFPQDIGGASERWVRARYPTLCYYRLAERGGHFPAFECPEVFIREIRNGARAIRAARGEAA